MAIIQNRSTEIGDCIRVVADSYTIGLVALTGFLDVTVGETGTRLFKKQFRYSIDGINFSPLQDLTIPNLELIDVNITSTFIAEYYYTRIGSDTSGELEFDSVTLEGEIIPPTTGAAFKATSYYSILGDVNNLCSIAWSINVLEKLYKQGILPKYIERNTSSSNSVDKDFIDFWRSITHYFALFVCTARYYQNFYTDPKLLLEYLQQRGLFICEDQDYEGLIYLMQNYYDEIRQRGTIQIFREKDYTDYVYIDSSISSSDSYSELYDENYTDVKEIDGEYLRLICYDDRDEFIVNVNKSKHVGWNIGNSSPNFKGLYNRMNCNKFYVEEFVTKSDLDLVNSQYCSLISDNQTSKVLNITGVPNGQVSGLLNSSSKLIKVNPNLDYDLTFMAKQFNCTTSLANLSVGVVGYDKDNNVIDFFKLENLAVQNYFLDNAYIQRNQITPDSSVSASDSHFAYTSENYIFVRCIIWNKDKYPTWSSLNSYSQFTIVRHSSSFYRATRSVPSSILLSNTTYWTLLTASEVRCSLRTNLTIGDNLLFDERITKLSLYIYNDNTNNSNGDLSVFDVRFQPLQTEYSKGYIGTNNLVEIWNTNNNHKFSNYDVSSNAKRYLLPYNVVLKSKFIESALS